MFYLIIYLEIIYSIIKLIYFYLGKYFLPEIKNKKRFIINNNIFKKSLIIHFYIINYNNILLFNYLIFLTGHYTDILSKFINKN